MIFSATIIESTALRDALLTKLESEGLRLGEAERIIQTVGYL